MNMTLHERAIAGILSEKETDMEAIETQVRLFVERLTHLPDPGLRRYCQEQILDAATLEDLSAAVSLVNDLCACFDAASVEAAETTRDALALGA
jgi:hypothetical protein